VISAPRAVVRCGILSVALLLLCPPAGCNPQNVVPDWSVASRGNGLEAERLVLPSQGALSSPGLRAQSLGRSDTLRFLTRARQSLLSNYPSVLGRSAIGILSL